jgi:hypothetical protein
LRAADPQFEVVFRYDRQRRPQNVILGSFVVLRMAMVMFFAARLMVRNQT